MAPLFQYLCRLARQFGQDRHHGFGARDRFGKAPLDAQRRDDPARGQRAVRLPHDPADRHHCARAETGGDGRHRATRDIADGFQPRAAQRQRRLFIQFQRGDGQAADRAILVTGRPRHIARQRPRALRRPGKGQPHRHAQPLQPPFQISRQPRLPTKEMIAPAGVEDQPVGRIERHGRRVTGAAISQPLQPILILMRHMVEQVEVRHAGAGVGHRQAGRQAQRRRGLIHRRQPQRAADLLDKGAGPFILPGAQMGPGQAQPLRREPGEEQGEIAAMPGRRRRDRHALLLPKPFH